MLLRLIHICMLFSGAITYGQNNQHLFFEVGKTGLIFNAGYDRQIHSKPFGFRLLAGSNFGKYLRGYTAAAGAYYLFLDAPSYIEIGMDIHYLLVDEVSDDQRGIRLMHPDYSVETIVPVLNFGFRRNLRSMIIRFGISGGAIRKQVVPGGYLGIGRSF